MNNRLVVLTVMVALTTGLSACGRKGSPRTPEDAFHPRPYPAQAISPKSPEPVEDESFDPLLKPQLQNSGPMRSLPFPEMSVSPKQQRAEDDDLFDPRATQPRFRDLKHPQADGTPVQ